jgi:hypothetical protein
MAHFPRGPGRTQQPGTTASFLQTSVSLDAHATILVYLQGMVNNKQLFKANVTITYECAEVAEVLAPNMCAIGSWSEWQVMSSNAEAVNLHIERLLHLQGTVA